MVGYLLVGFLMSTVFLRTLIRRTLIPFFSKIDRAPYKPVHPMNESGSKGKDTGQRVLSTHCVGHSQLAAHYEYQS